jgi:hypothetical protein
MSKKFLSLTTALIFGLSTLRADAGQAIIAVQPTNTPPVNVPSDPNAQPYFNTGTAFTYITTPPISLSAYASGNCVGGAQAVAGASRFSSSGVATAPKSLWITSIQIIDRSIQNIPIDLVVFDNNNGLYTDNTPCNINAADTGKIIAVFHITDWSTAGYGLAFYNANFHILSVAPSGNLYIIAVARGAATYTALALTFKYSIIQD